MKPATTEAGHVRLCIELDGGPVDVHITEATAGHEREPALVLLHEGLGSVDLWRDFPARLASRTGRRTITWSRHGYGRSGPADVPRPVGYLHDEALGALPELLDRLDVTAPVLVGHSDGASIALIHAGGADRRTAGLVVISPHLMVEDCSIAAIEAARASYLTSDLAARMAPHHADADATFWGWNDIWLSPEFRAWNIESFLPAITVPVLAIQCEDDPYGTLEQLDRIERHVAGPYTAVVLPGRGHAPHLAHADAVLDAVERSLCSDG